MARGFKGGHFSGREVASQIKSSLKSVNINSGISDTVKALNGIDISEYNSTIASAVDQINSAETRRSIKQATRSVKQDLRAIDLGSELNDIDFDSSLKSGINEVKSLKASDYTKSLGELGSIDVNTDLDIDGTLSEYFDGTSAIGSTQISSLLKDAVSAANSIDGNDLKSKLDSALGSLGTGAPAFKDAVTKIDTKGIAKNLKDISPELKKVKTPKLDGGVLGTVINSIENVDANSITDNLDLSAIEDIDI